MAAVSQSSHRPELGWHDRSFRFPGTVTTGSPFFLLATEFQKASMIVVCPLSPEDYSLRG